MNIDIHAHCVPKALLDDLAARRHSFPSVQAIADNGVRVSFSGQDAKRPVFSAMSDVDKRRGWLNERGIDKQIVAGWVDLFGYELPAEEGADWSRFLNEHMLQGVAQVEEFVDCCNFSAAERAAVVGGTAAKVFGIPRKTKA